MPVTMGRIMLTDKAENAGADALAVAGAATHAVPPAGLESAASRRRVALHVHGMMLAIVKARQLALPCQDEPGPDRGSDCDCDSDSDVSSVSVSSVCSVVAPAVDAASDNEYFNHGF